MFTSPTFGQVTPNSLKKVISDFMAVNKSAIYRIIVGSDSQKVKTDTHDFVSALIIHRVGEGGIYFWERHLVNQKMGLKERIYREAIGSLETAEYFVNLFRGNGISRYNIEIHVDIGNNGETRGLINEVVGMIRSNGYQVKTKPDSFGASNVADRHT
ncbi:hypothetical protein A3C23_03005 [Candidatus Roizmanbacteria bacterium RIFCSPHIGHO2_02_FULL_37_13b]|uniref:DUF458 domain-containing protein n=1 Tax=Candidatus Roizmanbacteria bacterium RIFCSPLOWO2_02_FULL_36_11 TaxID=1802071 RepID=A0A1F7JI81_9BACT|nr:MAG: hypothetical protein A3C23_03005 [Candidatus Roizmanbacteria bacterium RIFCSPHIGHO2_02_FULL_37_13b]OGK55319.1 MAG: hypothetical protein A3H78_04435 [Candidatus Roizmanbacteria bacterium RIFCSPLOWO2_02_FULL_36_11]